MVIPLRHPYQISELRMFLHLQTLVWILRAHYITKKRTASYIVIYSYCTSRALHLDLVNDLSAPVFLRSLRRLTARRGMPSLINSDNAKTFKFAAKFLDSLSKDPSVFSFYRRKGSEGNLIWSEALGGVGILSV